ncbi:cysteine desulfurase [Candidatus Nomurabacteria bacterium]|nr:cysteine desulfurase [Candidatus Nomurabacteria bacterium]
MILGMKFLEKKQERVYLDWAAATPLLPEAKVAMLPFLENDFGNPGAIHAEGLRAKQAVETARDEVARSLEVRSEYVTFTSGGTESNNLAILGTIMNLRANRIDFVDMEVITTKIEHPSVLKTMDELQRRGVSVEYVSVDETGKIILSELKELVSAKTVLTTCSLVNSEIGVVQPLHAIKKVLKEAEEKFSTKIYFHVDAAQAPLWLNCQFTSIGADYLALDSAKCCGPKGIGLLVRSTRSELRSVEFGGGQESGLRPGTENVPAIVGTGVAFTFAQKNWRERSEKVSKIRDQGIEYILKTINGAVLNGPTGKDRVANNINISVPGMDTEFATVVLDKHGFAVSTKSACSGAGGGESVVVKAISRDPARALSTLRFTLGPANTFEQIKKMADILFKHKVKMKNLTQ